MDVLVFCLALNIYFEARNEPIDGRYAVAEVTLRRAIKSGRPVCNEVFTDSQFSWTIQSDNSTIKNKKAWNDSIAVAKASIVRVTDFSKGATHFHADYVRPAWTKRLCKTIKIGRHIFYKECGK